MPPQQVQHLLDFGDGFFDFCAHLISAVQLEALM